MRLGLQLREGIGGTTRGGGGERRDPLSLKPRGGAPPSQTQEKSMSTFYTRRSEGGSAIRKEGVFLRIACQRRSLRITFSQKKKKQKIKNQKLKKNPTKPQKNRTGRGPRGKEDLCLLGRVHLACCGTTQERNRVGEKKKSLPRWGRKAGPEASSGAPKQESNFRTGLSLSGSGGKRGRKKVRLVLGRNGARSRGGGNKGESTVRREKKKGWAQRKKEEKRRRGVRKIRSGIASSSRENNGRAMRKREKNTGQENAEPRSDGSAPKGYLRHRREKKRKRSTQPSSKKDPHIKEEKKSNRPSF